MARDKVYFLVPGEKFCKNNVAGFPGKKIDLKAKADDFLEVDKKYIEAISENIPYLMHIGRVVDKEGMEELIAKKEAEAEAAENKKLTGAEKLAALIEEAKSLGIEDIPENPTQKVVKDLIADKKAELESEGGDQ